MASSSGTRARTSHGGLPGDPRPDLLVGPPLHFWHPRENSLSPAVLLIFGGEFKSVGEGLGSKAAHPQRVAAECSWSPKRNVEALWKFHLSLWVQGQAWFFPKWESGLYILSFERGSGILGPVLFFFFFFCIFCLFGAFLRRIILF